MGRGKGYLPGEDIALCKAWIRAMDEPSTKHQTINVREEVWEKAQTIFCSYRPTNPKPGTWSDRKITALRIRWRQISRMLRTFEEIYLRFKESHKDWDEGGLVKNSLEEYYDGLGGLEKRGVFPLVDCWGLLSVSKAWSNAKRRASWDGSSIVGCKRMIDDPSTACTPKIGSNSGTLMAGHSPADVVRNSGRKSRRKIWPNAFGSSDGDGAETPNHTNIEHRDSDDDDRSATNVALERNGIVDEDEENGSLEKSQKRRIRISKEQAHVRELRTITNKHLKHIASQLQVQNDLLAKRNMIMLFSRPDAGKHAKKALHLLEEKMLAQHFEEVAVSDFV